MLKNRMLATQQASELEVGNAAYETLFQTPSNAPQPKVCKLPISKLHPFFTADIGFKPYSQTRSNTQRDLLQADEFLRLDRYKCVVMFNHYKPAHLYKIMLEELPEYKQLRKCSVFDYEPEWKSREEAERQRRAPEKRSDMEETESPPNLQQSTRNPDAHGAARQAADPPVAGKPSVPQRQETGNTCIYDIPSMKNATPESIGLVEMTRSAIISSDDPELEEMDDPSRIPPGRGI